ncbi:MAG: ABC transporter substrate-binding protein [Chloroflexi bacterium]|nr:ABC transporter substrate-binding protein [Chloroflexota bacterium]
MHVKVATQGIAGEAGGFIAQERGYFKDEGLDVEFVPVQGGPSVFPSLTAGELDYTAGAINAATINAIQRNISLRVVMPLTYIPPTDKNASLIVRQDLIDSGKYKDLKDLKGLSIGVGPSVPSTSEMSIRDALKKGGLTLQDVTEQPLGFTDELTALGGKKLDAAWEVEPFSTVAEQKKIAKAVQFVGELHPDYDPLDYLISPVFASKQPEAAKRFAVAVLRGQRDYYQAFQKNNGDKNAIYQILIKYTTLKDLDTWKALTDNGRMQSVDPNGAFHLSGFDSVEQYFVETKAITSATPAANLVDTSGIDYAVGRLGKMS